MIKFVEEHPDKVSSDTLTKIKEEYKFYQEGQSKLYYDMTKMRQIYDNRDRDLAVWVPPDNKQGFMGYFFQMDAFHIERYGSLIQSNQLKYEQGILNVIPYILEPTLYREWFPYINRVKKTKHINGTRFFFEEIFDFPFPLSKRRNDVYVQIFNNVEVNNKISFQLRTFNQNSHEFWLPSHI